MLTADYKGKRISMLDGWKREQIMEMNEKESFSCPICKEAVVPKLGTKKMWHFAHRSTSQCLDSFEKESYYHLLGKKQLYRWLSNLGHDAILEPFLPQSKQRPDVMIRKDQVAIEFQCATITEDLFLQRTNGYKKEDIQVFWILGDKRVKRIGVNLFRISSYDLAMLMGHERLVFFCPLSMVFRILSHIRPLSATKIYADECLVPLKSMTLQSLTEDCTAEEHDEKFHQLWTAEKKKWRLQSFQYHSPAYRYVKKIFSLHGHSLASFPSVCGVPSYGYYYIHTPAFLWQSWISFYITSCSPFTEGQLSDAFLRLVNSRIFSIRAYPFLEGSYETALNHYLDYLLRKGILREEDGFYTAVQAFRFHFSTLKALEEDEKLRVHEANFSQIRSFSGKM
ncbi:competence protein CoiA [Fictibacillus iocasae]|uniref:Competence protein CoiA n=1 Tax=Fictibacillus iocasae TaxID=2715437 RepID=A0ABW2NRK7_9BACL